MELAGKSILITRAASQSEELRTALEAAGATVLECPLLEIVPIDDWSAVDRAITQIDSYDWVVFTSTNAVEYFLKRASKAGAVCRVPIAAVGSSTAARLKEWNLTPALVPQDFRAEGLLEAFPSDLHGKRILVPRAESARELLPDELRRRGAVVDVLPVYRTSKASQGSMDLRLAMTREKVDVLVLTSPSAVRFLSETLGDEMLSMLSSTIIAVIGPVAAAAAAEAGLNAVIRPKRPTIAELVEAIRTYFSNPEAST